jgi:hypothetical protein
MRIAFYKGRSRFFNWFVSWWTRGPYSHCEAIFDGCKGIDGPVLCASASYLDGGVRFNTITLDPARWDVIDVPLIDPVRVSAWFSQHRGEAYDVLGLLSTSAPVRDMDHRWFCSEAMATAAGMREAWRFDPNSFARICELLGGMWIQGREAVKPAAILDVQQAAAQ